MVDNSIRKFLFDTNIYNNDDFKDILDCYGAFAELLLLRLLVRIHSKNGYYLEWNEDSIKSFIKRTGFTEESVCNIKDCVSLFLNAGIFSREKFNKYEILTSEPIQTHWRNYKMRCHFKYNINPQYWINIDDIDNSVIDQSSTENGCPIKQLCRSIEDWR